MISGDLSSKDVVLHILKALPDEVSLQEIIERIEFVAAVRQGISELNQEIKIPLEEIEKELASWAI